MGGERLGWREFWPFYLREHSNRTNRYLHTVGTTGALTLLVVAIVTGLWWLIAVALVSGYAFAWVGHFFFQRNRPATFTYPIKSFAMDWRLWFCTLTLQARKEYDKHGIEQS